jgi:hypothetical protein
MRYRLMASYLGAPYQAGVGPTDRDVTLFSALPPPEELGFASASGHWRKQVRLTDIDALWESRPVGNYRGEPCLVLDDLGDRLHIAYLGMDERRAGQLGYWQVDRGVFEVVVARQEISDLAEEQHEFPLPLLLASLPRALNAGEPEMLPPGMPARSGQPSGPAPQAPGWSPAAPLPPPPQAVAPPGGPALSPGESTMPQPPVPAAGSRPQGRAAAWHGSPAPEEEGTWYDYPRSDGYPPRNDEYAPRNDGYPPQQQDSPYAPQNGGQPDGGYSPPNGASRQDSPYPQQNGAADRPNGTERQPGQAPAAAPARSGVTVRGRRAARKPRVAMQSVFADLLDMADIPRSAYAVDEEVTDAMCLIKTDGGFEVFSCAEDARHEVRFFEDEEAAYFYLFGVLAAEAVRNGRLAPGQDGHPARG